MVKTNLKIRDAVRSKCCKYKSLFTVVTFLSVVTFLLTFIYYRVFFDDYDTNNRIQYKGDSRYSMNVIDDVVVEKSIVVRSEEGDKEKNWIGTSTKEVEEETNTKEEDDDEEKKTREESQTNDNSLAVNIINSKEEDNDDVKNPKDSNKKEDDTEEVETRKRQRAYTESGNKTLLATDGDEPSLTDTEQKQQKDQHIFFVHINKTGGTSMIQMLSQQCSSQYQSARWMDDNNIGHRTFHLTAHAHRDHYGIAQWNASTTFALVRHPLARQVSIFFFLLHNCERNANKCQNHDRFIPTDGSVTSNSTEEEKIQAFHDWIHTLYETYNTSTNSTNSKQNYLLGSIGHGNEVYATFNATQSSWLVDETGQHIVVEHVW
eukprot:CAMPEP_0172482064 /NCGR_PEP_ID=MMETSP1066-20121228/8342_1 /TAXON_ID=671091 /ORGANISM="Coscinodiscus wailesii, Strain CCMP2513" /LENGTH=374 /DNA_ID=CAMNT_0013244937 /DNA_START=143 /DNA_END=1264 /DNA_ORIENTATION=-